MHSGNLHDTGVRGRIKARFEEVRRLLWRYFHITFRVHMHAESVFANVRLRQRTIFYSKRSARTYMHRTAAAAVYLRTQRDSPDSVGTAAFL